jgi:lipoate-protein ligase A
MFAEPIRLLIDGPASGAWNMAVDEVLLESASSGVATLRFYQWEEPTLSLGYFQSLADREGHTASRQCPIVRRTTGGGAIVHDRELTYSIALPRSDRATIRDSTGLYDLAHETLIGILAELGIPAVQYNTIALPCSSEEQARQTKPFLCFQRRACPDVICRGAKIAGSAQRRRRGALLQHGSVLLGRSAAAPELPGIVELAGTAISPDLLADRWLVALAARLGTAFRPGSLSNPERERAEVLASERFSANTHVFRR